MPVLQLVHSLFFSIASFISLGFGTKKITYYVRLFITIDLLISLVVLAKLQNYLHSFSGIHWSSFHSFNFFLDFLFFREWNSLLVLEAALREDGLLRHERG